MSNLSELSIQLRKLQSEKNAQANEIDRLQRQLRILSELKGVSVSDVQTGLQAACEAEAHGELRAIAGKLQARVDGLELGGAGGSSRKFANGGGFDGDDKNIPTQNQFNEEAAARARTNLQLRIGELQEIESNLRGEMNSLYENFQALTERYTSLPDIALRDTIPLLNIAAPNPFIISMEFLSSSQEHQSTNSALTNKCTVESVGTSLESQRGRRIAKEYHGPNQYTCYYWKLQLFSVCYIKQRCGITANSSSQCITI
mmetsp:Transcript_31928/g.61080  ORF Transcript_31928/g.61080 Transcript_31928/m.61080 type:complete len:258 (-) Transcript_31928:1332-2105(-)